MEFIQFHPTALYTGGKVRRPTTPLWLSRAL